MYKSGEMKKRKSNKREREVHLHHGSLLTPTVVVTVVLEVATILILLAIT